MVAVIENVEQKLQEIDLKLENDQNKDLTSDDAVTQNKKSKKKQKKKGDKKVELKEGDLEDETDKENKASENQEKDENDTESGRVDGHRIFEKIFLV